MTQYLGAILVVLICFQGFGQKLEAKISENEFLIGEPISVTYSVQMSKGDSLNFQPKANTIEVRLVQGGALSGNGIELEIRDAFTDTFIYNQATKIWTGQYVVTAWDSGTYIIPGPSVIINDSTYSFRDIRFKSNLMDPVKGVEMYDNREGYADIPDQPFSMIKFLKKNWWWLSILVLIPMLYFLIKRLRKKQQPVQIVKAMSLKERTILAIEALENEKLWEKDKLKEHFVELSYILRSYLTSRYDISLLEKTTYESKILLTKKGLNDDTVDNIGRILSESDMVKFAKSKPDVVSILRVSTLAKQIVAETSPLEFDNFE